ncbi:hypothetical protein CMO83_01070 [Candidatus Woesearchaeota archaeon]|jgi:hypothetical protein|nr:hypothetical protein [Candidatus Woesearchaeota archaeon]MDP6648457.1 hypothetical protein [Candidatus Woesearchaeota archaeon]|tara:strand:+ start:36929 stop:37405 length:477 start_codon:yes stop_codon:yes gene_type:complete
MELTKREKRKLRLEKLRHESQEVQQEHEQRLEHQKQFQEQKTKSRKSKYYIIGAIVGILILAVGGFSVYSISKPGQYDGFAKCLTEKGAVMYGAMDWCQYTQAQKGMFGKSFDEIEYHEYQDLPGIKKTPTWVYQDKWYENVQSFESLAAITGCKLQG